LRQAPDAIVLDTTDMPFDRQVGEIVEVARRCFHLDRYNRPLSEGGE
jgi:hypothetical protein